MYIIILGNHNILLDVTETSELASDIHTQGNSNEPGIIMNTDGISPIRSSRTTIWPIIIAFTNLPRTKRMNKENLILVQFMLA